jgi:hypothetical protein
MPRFKVLFWRCQAAYNAPNTHRQEKRNVRLHNILERRMDIPMEHGDLQPCDLYNADDAFFS